MERALEYLINLETKTPYVGDERKLLHKLGKIEVIIKCLYKIIEIFNELFPFNFMQSPS